MSPIRVKWDESIAMDALEAALDLEGSSDDIEVAATKSLASLAGAADFSILASDRSDGGQSIPQWAAARGLNASASDWLGAEAQKRTLPYVRVVEIPDSTLDSRRPGSVFVIFQDEAATHLHHAGMPRSKARRVLSAFAEMTDNAIEHSSSPLRPFTTFEIGDSWWEFSVNDVGCGVPNS